VAELRSLAALTKLTAHPILKPALVLRFEYGTLIMTNPAILDDYTALLRCLTTEGCA
jgi:hypothetical protein